MIPTRKQPYGFDANFERAVVTLACSVPRFFGRVGEEIDPELLKTEPAKLAMRAARTMFKDTGHGPSACILVLQRLRRWMQDGKVTLEEIREVSDMFDEAEDAILPDPDGVIAELTPVLQQRLRDEAVKVAIDAYGKNGDLSKTIKLEERAARVGLVDTDVGTMLGTSSWAEVEALKDLERLKIGIPELDAELDGGLQRGGLGIMVGGPGGGKSMSLSHIAAVNLLDGLLVGYATLELPRPIILARVKACITSTPINSLLAGDTAQARAILKKYARSMGRLFVKDFTPYVTTIEDIKLWVSRIEDLQERSMDLLIVDYGDKLGAKMNAKAVGESDSGYTSGRISFEGLRIFSDEKKMFTWTASQSTRKKDKRKRLDLDDVADSMHKVRVGDLVITLNPQDEDGFSQLMYFIAKHRTGRARAEIGPFPTAFEIGQMVAL